MVAEFNDADTGLDVPKHASHVAGTGDDLTVIDESTAREVARMGRKLSGALDAVAFLAVKVVYGADVVETAASDEVARWRVGAGHDPARSQGDGVDFVCRVGVPDDEFPILGSRYEMPLVGRPMHCVDLCEMASEGAAGSHDDTGEGVDLCRHSAHCTGEIDVNKQGRV